MSQNECLHRCDEVRSIVWSQWCSIILQNLSNWHWWDLIIKKQPKLLPVAAGGCRKWKGLSGVCPCWVSFAHKWALPEPALSHAVWVTLASWEHEWSASKGWALCSDNKAKAFLVFGCWDSRAGMFGQCHWVLYSHQECPVSSPIWGRTLSQLSNNKPQ